MVKEIKRKCQACNQLFNREDLIKITRLKSGEIKINPTSKEIGRSVYVCKNKECVKIFLKKKKIRLLKSENSEAILKIVNELENFSNF